MKVCTTLVALLLVGLGSAAAQRKPQPAPQKPALQQTAPPAGATAMAQTRIDPAKEADIRRLLDIGGTKKLIVDTMDSTSTSIRPVLTNSLPPGEYREKLIDLFFAKFKSKADVTHLLELAIPIYDKYFSHDEIKSLIRFYETPTGQKALSVLPQLMNEMRGEGEKWGQKLGRESMQEVLTEHPEMEAALEAAGKAGAAK
jgi:hypothetical protein